VIFFRSQRTKQDITRALELAAVCEHKEAQWLTRVLAGKTEQDALAVFLALEENDARGLCFAALLDGSDDDHGIDEEDEIAALLRRSAELGCALAQARMADVADDDYEMFKFATLAASQREREGFYHLGYCFQLGDGCEKNKDKAKVNYLIAAELGHVTAMGLIGQFLDESDPVRWVWWCQAAKRGESHDFCSNFAEQVHQFESGSGNAAVVFLIGRILNGNVDTEKGSIFGDDDEFDNLIGPAKFSISFYKAQLSSCRLAVDAWSLCCLRLNIYKDLRVLFGNMIWETRDLALFDVREGNAVASPDLKSARK
jgi:TPR repeat protein